MLNNGVWQGQQIIPRRWIIESTAEYNPGYGYLWWKFLIQCGDSWIESTVAAGAGGQRIYIIPDLEMVVVFTAGYYDPDNEVLGGQHTHEIVEDYLVPAILSEYPLPPPPSG